MKRSRRRLTDREAQSLKAQLQERILESGLSNYEISKRTGVDKATLGRFLAGERTITVDTADKISSGLGIKWHASQVMK